ncbi:MAG: hypothetical protein NTV81_01005 [Candidatus Komeilibacteria bacterium]|nr:hypothetical protein [Candidatus Komeilibacteria bacterium]
MATTAKVNSRYPRRKKSGGWLLFLVLLLLLISGATLGGWLLFGKPTASSGVKVTLTMPPTLTSGQLVKLMVDYVNQDHVGANNLELVLTYPEGFYFASASLPPQAKSQNIWELPALDPGQSGKLEISGQIVGKVGDAKKWQSRLSYQPANINSPFVSEAGIESVITAAIIEGTVVAPSQILSNQPITLTLNARNATANSLKKLKVFWELPPTWKVIGTFPSSTLPSRWLVEELPAQQEQQFKVSIDKVPAGSYYWRATVSQLADNQTEQILYQNRGSVEAAANQVNVGVRLIQPQGAVNWGDQLVLEVALKNPTQSSLSSVITNLTFNGQLIDWSKWTPVEGVSVKDGVVSWAASDLPAEQDRTQVISLPLVAKPTDIDLLDPEELILNILAKTSYQLDSQSIIITSVPLSVSVVGGLNLFAQVRYFADGQTVGAGALPPKVGTSTQYRIYWKVLGGDGLNKASVKTVLPPYVNFEKMVSENRPGSLTFVSSSRQVIWNLGQLAPKDFVGASFLVSVVPQANQVNQLLILSQNALLSGQALGTNKPTTVEAPLLTSELVGDKQAAGKGKVVP